MPVDTSIYANAAPQPQNPLAVASGIAGLQNAQNQNRLFGQEFAARKAVGQAYSNALDPTTGQVDVNKLVAGVASNPDAAFKAGEVGQSALTMQQGQTALDAARVALARTHFANLASGFGSLAMTPDLTPKHFTDLATDYVAQGMITPQTAATELAQLPPNATPQQLQQVAKSFQLRALDGAAQIDKMYGSPQVINNGSGQQVVAASPLMGTTTAISPVIPNALSPGEKAARVGTFVNGQPGTTNAGSLTDQYGNAVPQGSAGGAALGTGRYPVQPAAGAPAPAAAAPAGFVASGPRMGASAAADVTANASANQGVTLQQTADQVPQRKALLGNLDSALDNFTSGPGADWTRVGKALTNRASPFGNIFDPQSIASQEEFNKQATQLAQSQFQALGGTGTDAKLDSAMHTSPNDALSPMGNKGIINMLKGNEDAINVKNQEWQAYLKKGGSPAAYGDFSAQFNKQFDPRVFQSVYMTPDQKQDLLKGLDKSEKDQFRQTYNYAVQRGWIPDPQAPNAGK